MQDIMKVTGIYIYPIKSLGGISLTQSEVMPRGLQYDRRWLLIDSEGGFMTQRKYTQMTQLHLEQSESGLRVKHASNPGWNWDLPFNLETGPEVEATIWKDQVNAVEADAETNEWFSDMLHTRCKLVYMPDRSQRQIDLGFSEPGEVVSFADGYPLLILGENSLVDLNSRLETPVGMERFRPNLVFSGGAPFIEDTFSTFSIGGVKLAGAKTCARCVIPSVNPVTGKKGKEPSKTLNDYRNVEGRVIFGMNCIPKEMGTIHLGDELK